MDHTNMDAPIEETTLATISLLEARILRIEHALYGHVVPDPAPVKRSAVQSLSNLDRRFGTLLREVRTYAELLKIYKSHPDLFHPPAPNEPPSTLPAPALRALVLASAPAYPSTASALTTALGDENDGGNSVPDPSLSASLAALLPRMRAVEATQRAQQAEMAALRARSERVLRTWYEDGLLRSSEAVADFETRAAAIEKGMRRAEKARDEED